MVYGLYRALPGDRAFLPPSPAESYPSADLTPASGRQDHTTSPSAGSALVSVPPASTASRPAFVTIAKRPSEGWDRIDILLLPPSRQAKILKIRNRSRDAFFAGTARLLAVGDYELGGQGSNLFWRATSVQNWARQNPPILRLRRPQDPRPSATQRPLHQFPLLIGSERTRMRDSPNTTTAPPDNPGSNGDKFAKSSASCRAGVRLVVPRNRRSDGQLRASAPIG
jgi:hypothetical protein